MKRSKRQTAKAETRKDKLLQSASSSEWPKGDGEGREGQGYEGKVVVDSMSLNPELWGPHAWNMLHGLPFLFPSLFYGNRARQFLRVFADLVPCGMCEKHFKQFMQDVPLVGKWAADAHGVAAWLNKSHNAVNKRNHKPEWSLDRHTAKYERMTSRQWATETFTTLYYLLEYERLKRGQLFLFLQNLILLLQEATQDTPSFSQQQPESLHPLPARRSYPTFLKQMAEKLSVGLGTRQSVVGCHVSCLQMHLHTIENDVMTRSSVLQRRLSDLHI